MMKISSLLSITLLGISTYLLLELVFGSYGFLAYRAMGDFVVHAEEELEELQVRHDELRLQVHLLSSNRETVRIEARDIGYIGEDEVILRIEGREPRPRHQYTPGAAPPPMPQPRDNRPLFRALALTVVLVALLVETLRSAASTDDLHLHRQRRNEEWDIEVEGESFQI